jgi:hypothetical protein
LQENGNLATANWISVTNAVNLVGGQYQVSLPISRTNTFFRLAAP